MKNNFFKKVGVFALILCLTLTLSGCKTKEEQGNTDSSTNSNSQQSKDSKNNDLVAFDYMSKLDPSNTVEEINAVIGSNGELTDEKYNEYTWKISDDTKITATYYSSKKATIKVDIKNDLLKDDKADLSCAQDLKSQINSENGLKYEDFVSKIGSEGHIVEKSSSSTSYKWVNSKGGYLKGSFSNSSGKCTFFSAFA